MQARFQRPTQPPRPLAHVPPGHIPANDIIPQKRFGLDDTIHFWQTGTSPIGPIMRAYDRGTRSSMEDPIWHIWSEILRVYIPNVVDPGQPFWTIQREPYRGPDMEDLNDVRPDISATLWTPRSIPRPGQRPVLDSRDILWVECKAAVHDTWGGWSDLMKQTTRRLQIACPNQTVFVLLATGLKCMYFVWQPDLPPGVSREEECLNTIRQQKLWMSNGYTVYDAPKELKALHDSSWKLATGEIKLDRLMHLDCWTCTGRNQAYLDNHKNLTDIEIFITTVIQTAMVAQQNPDDWC